MSLSWHEHAGIKLAVAETGSAEASQTMVFQHGLCGDASQPAEVFPADRNWRSLTLECRGHGRSEVGGFDQFSIATFTGDVLSLIEARALAPVVLGGISMGAAISARLAITKPDAVRALVLVRPAWLTEAAPLSMQPFALTGDLLQRHSPKDALAIFEASNTARMLAAEAPDNLASLRGFFAREPIAVTRELLCRLSADGPGITEQDLRAIRVPTLVIAHRRDFAHPLSMAEKMATLIPRASLVEVTPKADSLAAFRHDVQAALAAFLKDL